MRATSEIKDKLKQMKDLTINQKKVIDFLEFKCETPPHLFRTSVNKKFFLACYNYVYGTEIKRFDKLPKEHLYEISEAMATFYIKRVVSHRNHIRCGTYLSIKNDGNREKVLRLFLKVLDLISEINPILRIPFLFYFFYYSEDIFTNNKQFFSLKDPTPPKFLNEYFKLLNGLAEYELFYMLRMSPVLIHPDYILKWALRFDRLNIIEKLLNYKYLSDQWQLRVNMSIEIYRPQKLKFVFKWHNDKFHEYISYYKYYPEAAYTGNPICYNLTKEMFLTIDEKLLLKLIDKNLMALTFVPHSYWTKDRIKFFIENKSGTVLQYIDKSLFDQEICDLALAKTPSVINFIPKEFVNKNLLMKKMLESKHKKSLKRKLLSIAKAEQKEKGKINAT
jgi:hypothetical protein